MSDQAFQFLSEIPLFMTFKKNELRKVAKSMFAKNYPKGATLAVQGKTTVEGICIVNDGVLDLYFENRGKKLSSGRIKKGDIFGGVSILMNSGLSIRTVVVEEDVSFWVIPKNVFLELCRRYNLFYDYFVDLFNKWMKDESYAAMLASAQAQQFLSGIDPFSFLPEEELAQIVPELSLVHYPKDTLLFEQGRSKIEYFYIMQRGAAERYYIQDDQKILSGILGEGDVYGGISILLNDGIALRMLKAIEDTYFYVLPQKLFLDICHRYSVFTDYFTDTFGKRMLDRSYAAIVRKTFLSKMETPDFFNQTVDGLLRDELVACEAEQAIHDAALLMTQKKCSSILVKETSGKMVGLVTDTDLREKVVAKKLDTQTSVAAIMSSPLNTISSDAFVFETLMAMMQSNIKHLVVTDNQENVIGVITNRDLLNAQGHSPLFLIREISEASTLDEVINKQTQIPGFAHSLINSGAKAKNVNRFVSAVSDAILDKLIDFALKDLGAPPASFAFMILGSDGRREQTLKTDQDNAIVFADVPSRSLDEVQAYFLQFGEKVCGWLDQAGYDFCEGEIMAKNPKWCQPLGVWKNNFSNWIHAAQPEDLLQSSIFFDFRLGYGDADLINQLRTYLFTALSGWSGFFRHLTENALYFKPPIGFFRNFVVESKGEHRNKFDIKSAMMPIVDCARIYSLKNKLDETNTLERLQQLNHIGVLSKEEYNELEQSYSFLMQLRIVRQITAIIEENKRPDNYINPKELSRIEQTMLKEIFKRIEKFQRKIDIEFTGLT
jgi:CBS domain-containing protein